MKKLSCIIALSVVLVFAMAAIAFANTTSTYATWNSGGANTGSLPTPHKDYRLTTIKCAVCHAVHKANTTGQILLADTVANACVYCHIQTTVGGVQIYGGDPTWFTTSTDQAHNNGCSGCHAVHGAGTINTGGTFADLDARILRVTPANNSVQSNAPWGYGDAARSGVVSAFCSACHPYYVGSYEATHAGSFGSGTYKGHIMTTNTASYNNLNATQATGSPVAYASDFYCRDCHDDGNVAQGAGGPWSDNFPHYTTGHRFMESATSVLGTDTAPTSNATEDGACLKCHRNGLGAGIGQTF